MQDAKLGRLFVQLFSCVCFRYQYPPLSHLINNRKLDITCTTGYFTLLATCTAIHIAFFVFSSSVLTIFNTGPIPKFCSIATCH